MLAEDHLALKELRLRFPEKWSHEQSGLCFLFAKKGWGEYVYKKKRGVLAVGDVMVLNTASRGRLSAAKGGDLVAQYFYACLEVLPGLFSAREISLLRNISESLRVAKVYAAGTVLGRKCHALLDDAPAEVTLQHRCHLLKIAATILSTELQEAGLAKVGSLRTEDDVTRMCEQLSQAEIMHSSVGDMAARFGCTRRHVNRLFHKHFGVSFASLKMELRLLRAASLLQDSACTVAEVAKNCGFTHSGLFNRCFNRRFRTSPVQWRKSRMLIKKSLALPGQAPPTS